MSEGTVPPFAGDITVGTALPEARELFNLDDVDFVTARVTTQNSVYILIARPGMVRLVNTKTGDVHRGDGVRVASGCLLITGDKSGAY